METKRPETNAVFDSFSEQARNDLYHLRELIEETAHETKEIARIEETLKWEEPSYISKIGSTIRLGWRQKDTA